MRFISWNVNGLRAVMKKRLRGYILELQRRFHLPAGDKAAGGADRA